MPSMPLPPGMGVLQAMGMMGGPPPPGIRMSMEPPGVSSGMVQDDLQKMSQRSSQAAQLLEHERQQKLVKLQQTGPPGTRAPEPGPAPNRLPPIPPLRGEDDDDMADTGMNSSRPYSDDEEKNALSKKDKSRKRRNCKKKRNQEKSEQVEWRKSETEKDKEKDPEVEIEYVTEEPEIYDPNYILKEKERQRRQ
ncbi:splicing factor 3B subunit 2 [Silurus meridionalis]|nr:splicing factor 3B subunit 2 [Silurus meridionalis]